MPQEKKKNAPRRKLRGMEVAQVALMLVIAVAVALAIYAITSGMVGSTGVPKVQVDAFNSKIFSNTANVTLKFGEGGSVTSVVIYGADGNPLTSPCTPSNINVRSGQAVEFRCTLQAGRTWQSRMIVYVRFADGRVAKPEWIVG